MRIDLIFILDEEDVALYACVCHAIRTSDLDDLFASGRARSVSAAFSALGFRPRCGLCVRFVSERFRMLSSAEFNVSRISTHQGSSEKEVDSCADAALGVLGIGGFDEVNVLSGGDFHDADIGASEERRERDSGGD